MVYLGNPLLPINITATSAADSIKKKLESKNWHEYELKPLKLNLLPHFLFNYHYFVEEGGDPKKSVKSTVHGILAVDGHDITIRDDLVELIKANWKKTSTQIPRGEFYEKWCNIEKREQDEVLTLKTAEFFGVPKQNVVISSAKKMMIPVYKTSVKIDGKDYLLSVNAVDSSIEGMKEIPTREKGYLEITKETINDLKKPSSWIKYSKEAINEGGNAFSGKNTSKQSENKSSSPKNGLKGIDLSFLDNKAILILIMILGLALIIMGLFKIKPI